MVITLYKPQAALLQEALAKSLDPHRMALIKANLSYVPLCPTPAQRQRESAVLQCCARVSCLQVVTVDAAQGSEAPHIVLSTVRSNSARSIGFAHNPRRLNVAISRAQKTLSIVGNKDVFNTSQPNWNRVVSTFCRQGQASDVSAHALQHAPSWHFVQQRALEMMERSASKGKGKGKGKGHGAQGKGGKGGKGKGEWFTGVDIPQPAEVSHLPQRRMIQDSGSSATSMQSLAGMHNLVAAAHNTKVWVSRQRVL